MHIYSCSTSVCKDTNEFLFQIFLVTMIHNQIMNNFTWTWEDERLFPTYHAKKGHEPNTRKKGILSCLAAGQAKWPSHILEAILLTWLSYSGVHGMSLTFFLPFPPSSLPINFSHLKEASLRKIHQWTKVFCGFVFVQRSHTKVSYTRWCAYFDKPSKNVRGVHLLKKLYCIAISFLWARRFCSLTMIFLLLAFYCLLTRNEKTLMNFAHPPYRSTPSSLESCFDRVSSIFSPRHTACAVIRARAQPWGKAQLSI